jgi:glycerol-3-phosphate cytidylyltransferase
MSTTHIYQVQELSDADIFGPVAQQQIAELRERRRATGIRIGFTASSFDLLHPGHVVMLADARSRCDLLVCALQSDPTLNRPDTKNAPIQSLEERRVMLAAIRHVDCIIEYATEADLHRILVELEPDVRCLGSDWRGKPYTGHELTQIAVFFHDRSGHSWSTTALRQRIHRAESIRLGLSA